MKHIYLAVIVALMSTLALGTVMETKESTTAKKRKPANTTPIVKTALDKFIVDIANKSGASSDAVTLWIKKNADNLNVTAAKDYEFGAAKLLKEDEDLIVSALSKSTKFKLKFNVATAEMNDLVAVYKKASDSAGAMSTTGKTTYMSTMEKKTNAVTDAGSDPVKSKFGSEVTDAASKITNPQTREIAMQRLQVLETIAKENPELMGVTKSMVTEAMEITAITDRQVFGPGCKNAADQEAFTNLGETLRLTKNDVKAGKNLDESFQGNLAKVTENDTKNICQFNIIPLARKGGACEVLDHKFATNCK